jgi:formylglycine-generating enzyme required for sulfatase activity
MKRDLRKAAYLCLILAVTGVFSCTSLGSGGYGTSEEVEVFMGTMEDSKTFSVNGISFNFVPVPGTGPEGFRRDMFDLNISIITNPWYMAETEVTLELFNEVMGGLPPGNILAIPFQEEDQGKKPVVEGFNWYMAITFCNKLSLLCGLDPVYSIWGIGDWTDILLADIPLRQNSLWDAVTWDNTKNGFRLPTEMEWKWAAMGADKGGPDVRKRGWSKKFAGSDGTNRIDDYAWANDKECHQAALKKPNELGLYDMSGNASEYVWDGCVSKPHPTDPLPNGTLKDYKGIPYDGENPKRVICLGGAFSSNPAEQSFTIGSHESSSMWAFNTGGRVYGFRIALNP